MTEVTVQRGTNDRLKSLETRLANLERKINMLESQNVQRQMEARQIRRELEKK